MIDAFKYKDYCYTFLNFFSSIYIGQSPCSTNMSVFFFNSIYILISSVDSKKNDLDNLSLILKTVVVTSQVHFKKSILKATDIQKGNEIHFLLGLAGLFEYVCSNKIYLFCFEKIQNSPPNAQ